MRRVEGNPIPGNSLTGDDLPVPVHCPVCGRLLKLWGWTTVDGKNRYDSLICRGRWPWLPSLGPDTMGAHYQYELPVRPIAVPPDKYDRITGAPL